MVQKSSVVPSSSVRSRVLLSVALLCCCAALPAVAADPGSAAAPDSATAVDSPPAAAPPARKAPVPSPTPVPLETLVADMLDHNPELEFYRSEIRAAKGERTTAGLWSNPQLTTTAGGKQVHNSGLTSEGTAWSVSVQQTFDWPGRIPLRKAVANGQVKLAELGLAEFRSTLASRARSLAYGLFAAQRKAAAARAVAGRFHELRDVMVQRDPAGLTPQLEVRILEATALVMQRRATQADLAAGEALLELNQLRGADWSDALAIEPVTLAFREVPGREKLLAAAQQNSFALQMRRAELEQQGFRVELARKDGYPTISVGPYFFQERAADRERQFGVGVTVPLPLWDRNQGGVEVAEARLMQARTTLLVAQRDLDRQVVEAALAYEVKMREMERWRPESVDEFRRAAELADEHYRVGAVPVATYVELQRQYLDAVEALLDTRSEALDAAQELERLTGLPLDAVRVDTAGGKR